LAPRIGKQGVGEGGRGRGERREGGEESGREGGTNSKVTEGTSPGDTNGRARNRTIFIYGKTSSGHETHALYCVLSNHARMEC
jgi:hypothetical protein